MEVLECLQGLVGVSDTDCPCTETDRPEGYNESKSGLFLSDLIDLKMMGAAATDCGAGSIWAIGAKALNRASINFQNNLAQCWADKHKARKAYIGHLAEITHTKALSPSSTYAGMKIVPDPAIESGEIIIRGISTLFSTTGTDNLTVFIYDAVGLVTEVDLNTYANDLQHNNLSPVITLPFQRDGVSEQAFYLIYAVDPANKPRNNELICGCRKSVRDKIEAWAPHVSGITGNVIADRCDWGCDNEHAYGLVPDVTMRCNVTDAICDGELDFGADPNAGTIAQHIQYAGAADLIGKVLRSSDPSVFTLHTNDDLVAMRNQYLAEASARLQGLCKTMPPGNCYTCKDRGGRQTLKF